MSITQRTLTSLRRHRTHRRDALTVRDSPSNIALSATGSYRFIRDY